MGRVRQLKVLHRIADLINSTSNTSTLLRRIVRETADAFDSSATVLALENTTGGGEVRVGAAQGVEGEEVILDSPLAATHLAVQAITGRRFLTVQPGVEMGLAEMATTLPGDAHPVAALYICRRDSPAFTDEEERLFLAVAAQSAKIIETSRRNDRLQQQSQRLEKLFEVGQVLISTDPLPEILNRVTQSLLSIIDVTQCTVLLVGKGHDLQLSAASGNAGNYTQRREVTDSLVEKFSAKGEPVRVLDVRKSAGRRPGKLPKQERLSSLLAVPIFYQQALVGILNIYTPEPRRFDPAEMQLFKGFASLCGVAIKNARQHERLLAAAEEIRLIERAGTLQALAGEISQRVRNPLTASQLLLDTIRDEGAFPPGRGADYEVLSESLAQIESTVTRLQELAHRRSPQLEWLDMNRIVEDVLALCQHRLAARQIMIHKRLTSDLPRVLAGSGEVQLVVLQSVNNAMEAMSHGGILNLSTSLVAGPEDKGGVPMVRINVRDTGTGLGGDESESVFDPFSRRSGSKVGYGLFVAEKLIRKYGGRLTVRNASDHGTSVSLTMPALENQ